MMMPLTPSTLRPSRPLWRRIAQCLVRGSRGPWREGAGPPSIGRVALQTIFLERCRPTASIDAVPSLAGDQDGRRRFRTAGSTARGFAEQHRGMEEGPISEIPANKFTLEGTMEALLDSRQAWKEGSMDPRQMPRISHSVAPGVST